MELLAAKALVAGASPTEAARIAGYREPLASAKRLRRRQAFTDFCISHMREKVVKYHEILELSKRNLVFLLSSDETPDAVRATVSLGVLRHLSKTGRDGKSLIERALDEDKHEVDPRIIAQRLLATHTIAAPPDLPGPAVIDVTPEVV